MKSNEIKQYTPLLIEYKSKISKIGIRSIVERIESTFYDDNIVRCFFNSLQK